MPLIAESALGDTIRDIISVAALAITTGIGLYFLFRKRKRDDTIEESEASLNRRKAERAEERKVRKDLIDELYEALRVQKEDLAANREEIHGLRGELSDVKVRLAIAETELRVCRDDRQRLHEEIAQLRTEDKRGGA